MVITLFCLIRILVILLNKLENQKCISKEASYSSVAGTQEYQHWHSKTDCKNKCGACCGAETLFNSKS